MDDGSTDRTAKFIRQKYPAVKVIRQENSGVSAARNAGIAVADGDWIALLDSDDEWLPGKLEKQFIQLARQPGLQICHCDEIWIRNGVRVNPHKKHAKPHGWIFDACLPLCCVSPSSVVIAKPLFQSVGGFDESLPACEDYDLWLRMFCCHPVAYRDEKLIRKYAGHEDQLSTKYWGMDRFRVRALTRLLDEGCLNARQIAATRAQLHRKLQVLAAGARKRSKQADVIFYEGIAEKYGKSGTGG